MELPALLGLLRFVFSVLEFTKHKHRLRISYTIVLPRRNVAVVRIGLLYSLRSITVKLQKQIENNTAFLSVQELQVGLLLFIKSLYRWLCYVFLLSQFCLQQFSKS